jgi:transposase
LTNNPSTVGPRSASLRSIKTPDEKDRIIAELTERNRLLEQKIDALIKILYGVKSEKIDPAQLQLLLDGFDPEKPNAPSGNNDPEPEGADEAKLENKRTKSKNHSRLKGWDQLEVIEQTIFPDGYEEHKDQLELIGQEVTELLDYIPARLIKQRTIRPKFRQKDDRSQAPLVAAAPASPLPGGLPTFGLTAELIISKYADHLPIYRQQSIFQRLGLHAPRDTLNHWSLQSLELLRPIAEAIHLECLSSSYLQLDETPIKELAPGTGKTRTGYVWVLNDPCPGGSVSYRWQNGRSRKDLDQALGKHAEDWKGIFQSDGYSVYPSYQRDHAQDIDLGSCMAHIRRGFTKALDAGEPRAARVIQLIAYLYRLEKNLRDTQAGPALRDAIRASHCAPRLRLIRRYLEKIKSLHFPKSLMGQAISYALNQWYGLAVYLSDGRVELDNNLCENAIRPLKIGAKNYLFFGSRRGGELGCVAYTLIENCKRHGLPIRSYLIQAMKALVENGPNRAAELTPAAIAKARRKNQAA